MRSDAQKRADRKYRAKVKNMLIEFYPTEVELIEHLESQTNKQGYIKRLIREDIKREQV